MLLTEIAPLEKWKDLEDKIQQQCDLEVTVFDTDGIRITDNKKWANRLCPAIKAIDNGQTHICAVANQNLAAMAVKSKKSIVEECDAGLVKVVLPLFSNQEYVGVVAGCGMLLEDGEVDEELIERTTGISESETAELSTDIKTITEEEAQNILSLIADELRENFKKIDRI